MKINLADRLKQLPPYLFAEIDRLKKEQVKKGVDVIDLGVADPDLPTPKHIIQALQKTAEDPANHQYPAYTGMNEFREAAAGWMQQRFGVKLEPLSNVVSIIGGKEGVANFALAFVNPGDVVLVPSPGYPPEISGTLFAGGIPFEMPLKRENRFLPDLKSVPADVLKKAKLLHINYPNNPTGALAPKTFFEEVVAFAKKHRLIVAHDAAYTEQFDQEKPLSFLQIPEAMEVGIEFHSLSKTFNMTGWRIGWACGNKDLVAGLGKVKSNIDSGIFRAIQWAGVAALQRGPESVDELRGIYRRRRQLVKEVLRKIGWDVACGEAALYVWVAVPKGFSSADFAKKVLEETGVILTPGIGFGKAGEGYVRFSLTRDEKRLAEALERLGKLKI